jgi:hypothetical protein
MGSGLRSYKILVDKVTKMSKINSREVTVNPRFGRRTWVKLWVNEWLEGTTRGEMSDAQRAFWIDLLAMAGRSRYPGVVCAGKSLEGKFIGYPINKFQSLMSEPIDVQETLALFERTGKVKVEITTAAPIKLMAIHLLSWDKYQSEYQRQKPYRDLKKLQDKLQKGYKTEVEVEVEGEGEGEGEGEKPTPVESGFESFWSVWPAERRVAKRQALRAWGKVPGIDRNLPDILAAVERYKLTAQWKNPQYIPHPATFINRRQWQDAIPEPYSGNAKRTDAAAAKFLRRVNGLA